jgi:hypothetical protein
MGQQGDNLFVLEIDPSTGKCQQFISKVPNSNYPTAACMSRTGKLYIGAAYAGHLLCCDPAKGALDDLGEINGDKAVFLKLPAVVTVGWAARRAWPASRRNIPSVMFSGWMASGFSSIENVGNLVCPAEFRVGEHAKVVAGTKEDLMAHGLIAGEMNWISFPKLTEKMEAWVQIRYRHPGVAAVISPGEEGKVIVDCLAWNLTKPLSLSTTKKTIPVTNQRR